MNKLIKIFRKFQKLVFVMAALTAVLLFAYSLSFSTDLYKLSYFMDDTGGFYVSGSRIYLAAQPFNKTLFYMSLLLGICTISLFVFFGHKRRIYYISNIITISLHSVLSIGIAVYALMYITEIRHLFLTQVDFAQYKEISEMLSLTDKYTESTFWLETGFIVCAIMMLMAVIMLVNMSCRLIAIRREKQSKKISLVGTIEDKDIRNPSKKASRKGRERVLKHIKSSCGKTLEKSLSQDKSEIRGREAINVEV